MSKKPKKIWGAIVNQGGGLWSDKPSEFKLDESWIGHRTNHVWWDKKLDMCIKTLGHDTRNYYCQTFGSTNKKEVELFIAGAKAVHSLIFEMFGSDWKQKWIKKGI